eukprot:TRINITY_DN67527_c4_g1_i1.p1 TRINITY_DN67527_c4_g1~~TRINITY_DN67527_c4_g1_i1.p1  ORF type:complete len:342 (+),score=181.19 TRINITY_DN67527_c4_g1_i1:59-1084(+)
MFGSSLHCRSVSGWTLAERFFKRAKRFRQDVHSRVATAKVKLGFTNTGDAEQIAKKLQDMGEQGVIGGRIANTRVFASPGSKLVLHGASLETTVLHGDKVKLFSPCLISGTLHCNKLLVDGEVNQVTSIGRLQVGSMVCTGAATVDHSVVCSDTLETQGKLIVGGALTAAKSIVATGMVKVGTMIKSDESFQLRLSGSSSHAGSIRAPSVSIEPLSSGLSQSMTSHQAGDKDNNNNNNNKNKNSGGSKSNQWLLDSVATVLRSATKIVVDDSIVGDNVNISHAHVLTVKGRHVVIGKECNVMTLYYSHTLEKHPEAVVRNVIHVADVNWKTATHTPTISFH